MSNHVDSFFLPEGTLLSLQPSGRSPTIDVLAGTVWVTQEGCLTDHILRTGSTVIVRNRGMVVIQVLSSGGAQVRIARVKSLGNQFPARQALDSRPPLLATP